MMLLLRRGCHCLILVRAFRQCLRSDLGDRRLRYLLCHVCHGSNDLKAHEYAYRPPLAFYYYYHPTDVHRSHLVLTLEVTQIQLGYYPNQDYLAHVIRLVAHVATLCFGFCLHQPLRVSSSMNDGATAGRRLRMLIHGYTEHRCLNCS